MSFQGWFDQVTSGDCCGAMWCPVGHTSVGHTYVLHSVVVMLQLMDEGQQLSKRQLELEGQTKRLRQQVKQLETQVGPILVWEQPPLSSVSCMAPRPVQGAMHHLVQFFACCWTHSMTGTIGTGGAVT